MNRFIFVDNALEKKKKKDCTGAVRSSYFKQIFANKMSNKRDKNLPSITTMVTHGDKRSGDCFTTENEEETFLAIKVREMLNISRVKKGQVDDRDLSEVVNNTAILLKENHKNEQVRKMYTRYQNLWMTFVAKENMDDEFNDIKLVKFFSQLKNRYSPNTLWVIYSCINSRFIDVYGLDLKSLPRLRKFLKQQTSKYVAKKSSTFDPEEIQELLMKLQDKPTTRATLHGVAIALLYFGLLRGSEVKEITVRDVIVKDSRILVKFMHDRKRRNEGFSYEVPSLYYPMFKKYVGQICQKTVDKGMVQFLKNWNIQAKRRVQNMGKNQINLLHGVACEILGKDPSSYTSHTWRRSAATNLADAGVSFINLKRHGQWISDSVVEGYIANSKPLRDERLHCLMPRDMRPKKVTEDRVEVVRKNDDATDKTAENPPRGIIEIAETVEVGEPLPDEPDLTTLIGFSQVFNPDLNLDFVPTAPTGLPLLTTEQNNTSLTTTTTNNPISAKPAAAPKNVESFLAAMSEKAATFVNCTFHFGR